MARSTQRKAPSRRAVSEPAAPSPPVVAPPAAPDVALQIAPTTERQVEILSEPPGARIEVNDNYIGDTPITTTFQCDTDSRFIENTRIRALPTQPGHYVQSKLFFGGYLTHARFAANYTPSTLNDKIPARIFFDMGLGPVSRDINVNVQ
jgi:PEGA domain